MHQRCCGSLFPTAGRRLQEFMLSFTDSRDTGPLLISHVSLLTGCAAPVWLAALGAGHAAPPAAGPASNPSPLVVGGGGGSTSFDGNGGGGMSFDGGDGLAATGGGAWRLGGVHVSSREDLCCRGDAPSLPEK